MACRGRRRDHCDLGSPGVRASGRPPAPGAARVGCSDDPPATGPTARRRRHPRHRVGRPAAPGADRGRGRRAGARGRHGRPGRRGHPGRDRAERPRPQGRLLARAATARRSTATTATGSCVPRGAEDGKRTMVVIGDSHARQWGSPLDILAERAGYTTYHLVRLGCPAADITPWLNKGDGPNVVCEQFHAWTVEQVRALQAGRRGAGHLVQPQRLPGRRRAGPRRGRAAAACCAKRWRG